MKTNTATFSCVSDVERQADSFLHLHGSTKPRRNFSSFLPTALPLLLAKYFSSVLISGSENRRAIRRVGANA